MFIIFVDGGFHRVQIDATCTRTDGRSVGESAINVGESAMCGWVEPRALDADPAALIIHLRWTPPFESLGSCPSSHQKPLNPVVVAGVAAQ